MNVQNHPWSDNPDWGDPNLRVPSTLHLPLFRQLVNRAKRLQHGSLTQAQYLRLRSAFHEARKPFGSPVVNWAMMNAIMLNTALDKEGVSIRWMRSPKLHRYRLEEVGMKRLSEIERKIITKRQLA